MLLKRLEVPNREIGAAFGSSEDEQQADMINACATALHTDCDRDQYRFEMQLHAICGCLNADGQKFIAELAECLKLRESDEQGS